MDAVVLWAVFSAVFFLSRPILHGVTGVSLPWEPLSLFWWLIGIVISYFLSGLRVADEWERYPVLRFGRYVQTGGPGIFWIEPISSDTLEAETVSDEVHELTVDGTQTHDNIPLSFTVVLTTRIQPDRIKEWIVELHGAFDAVEQRALAVIASQVSARELDVILHKRDEFDQAVLTDLKSRIYSWGVDVRAVEIKDLKIADEEIERAIAMKARAAKEGDAEIVRAYKQEEVAMALSLAGKALTAEGWRLKELEVLLEMTRSAQNNTVIPASAMNRLAISIPSSVPPAEAEQDPDNG